MTDADSLPLSLTEVPPTGHRTTQLRRYVLVPGTEQDFLVWWRERIVPGRVAAGFSVDYASFEAESRRFVWATSAAGSADDFLTLERKWLEGQTRAAAFAGEPQRVESMDNSLVERLA